MIVVTLNYMQVVLDSKDAVTLMDILSRAEKYESKYVRHEGDKEYTTTHHVYAQETITEAKVISDDLYRMAKLAGKPTNDYT
jgi:hypothetical protein